MSEAPASHAGSRRIRIQAPLFRPEGGTSILFGYTRGGFLSRHSAFAMLLLLGIMALYGAAFALLMPVLALPMLVPFAVMALLIIWLLPEIQRPPYRTLTISLFAYLIALSCWPDYLALALPGLPWITAIRLTGIPLVLVLCFCLSVSSISRRKVAMIMRAIPIASVLLLLFLITATFSLVLSSDIGASLNRYIVMMINWIAVFFASCIVFYRPNMVRRFTQVLWFCTIVICLIGVLEWRRRMVLWVGYIPSFLQIQDPNIEGVLAGSSRAASGIYRLVSRFTTSLGFGEFLALSTPFILHVAVVSRSIAVKSAGAGTLVLIAYCVFRTDSRLAFLGFFLSFLVYIAVYALLYLKRNPGNLLARLIILAYPLMFVAFVISTFTVDAIKFRVWGGGAAQFSTQARLMQWETGVPLVISHPLGQGIGRAAQTLNFITEGGALTIDSYYLSVLLEVGFLGFIGFYGFLIVMMVYGIRMLWGLELTYSDGDYLFIGPSIIAMFNFLVIKSVLSQQENHPLVFMICGMMAALLHRFKRGAG